jgi:peptidyl-prolyl cis-trans isomerase A (cyclophilin A)
MLKRVFISWAAALLLAGATIAGAAEPAAKNPVVVMETTMGTIKLELFPKEAPLSVKNFLDYVNQGFYTNTIFHRIIPGFMIQGGGFSTDRKQKMTNPPVKNEAGNGLKNNRGTLAMARTSRPDSATAQFFINVANNDGLNRPSPDGFGYAVFGKVIEGMDVADKIVNAKQVNVNEVFQNFPEPLIIIKSIKVLQ